MAASKSSSKSQSSSGASSGASFGARLLIILFALGIVVLGAYPIRRDIQGAAGKARAYLNDHMPDLAAYTKSKDRASLYRPEPSGSLVIDTEDLPAPERPKGITVDSKAKEREQLDRLSQKDKKELSELVNGF